MLISRSRQDQLTNIQRLQKSKELPPDFESDHLSDLALPTFLLAKWFVKSSIPFSDKFFTKIFRKMLANYVLT